MPITSCSHDQLLQALSSRDLARAAAAGVGSAQLTTRAGGRHRGYSCSRARPLRRTCSSWVRMTARSEPSAAGSRSRDGSSTRTRRSGPPTLTWSPRPRGTGTSSPRLARRGSRRSGRRPANRSPPSRPRSRTSGIADSSSAYRIQGEPRATRSSSPRRTVRSRAHVCDAARPQGDGHLRARADAPSVPASCACARDPGRDERLVAGAHRREPVGTRQATSVRPGAHSLQHRTPAAD